RGWRREQLQTSGGFTVDALGLDTAARGSKVDAARPDLIVLDDIDALHDGPAATAKKIESITKTILPAGSNDVAVLFIQNVILRDGVAAQLADGRADFLADRIVSGPFPAVEGLRWAWRDDPEDGLRHPVITAGRATWEGQSLEVCQRQMETWGPVAFLKEAQHEVKGRGDGVALQLPADPYVDLTDEEVQAKAKRCRAFAGIDFGSWRFGFVLFFMDEFGKVTRIDELFSQRESLDDRAAAIHDLVERAGIPDPSAKTCIIWGDAANPTDIREINSAFKRVGSRLRVAPVGHEGKMRKTAVERINNALATGALTFRRSVGHDQRWMLGANAGSEGTQMIGSRLMWEIDHWSFPVPVPGEPQDQNPDDATADGADLIAAMRYALMSYWKRPDIPPQPTGDREEDDAAMYDYKQKRVRKFERKVEEFLHGSPNPDLDLGAPSGLPLDW
ncbi:MAG: hypothetical protein KGL35_31195, partial [Bradyrhizobium sp.]|nr:hypothetical protein [Bradyrhizobium sp.]